MSHVSAANYSGQRLRNSGFESLKVQKCKQRPSWELRTSMYRKMLNSTADEKLIANSRFIIFHPYLPLVDLQHLNSHSTSFSNHPQSSVTLASAPIIWPGTNLFLLSVRSRTFGVLYQENSTPQRK
jgi:hypothetical protein